jgi:integrative and conjugative element protein (TIGR02256 family)
MPHPHTIVWIFRSILHDLVTEADRIFPNETGGVFMGYWVSTKELVITHAIGPGPHALHHASSFVPDDDYQQRQIQNIYDKTARTSTYLGDWHTHPNGAAIPSKSDRRTMNKIANHADARIATPLMGILAGSDDWQLVLWCLRPTRLGIFRSTVKSLTIKIC